MSAVGVKDDGFSDREDGVVCEDDCNFDDSEDGVVVVNARGCVVVNGFVVVDGVVVDNIVVGLRVVFCRGVVVFLVDVAVAGGVVVVAFEVVVVTARGSVVVVIGGDDFDVVVCVVVVVCIDADGVVVDCVVVVDGVVVVVVVVFVVVDEYALVDNDSDTWRVPSPLTATQTNWYLRTVVSGSRKLTDTFRLTATDVAPTASATYAPSSVFSVTFGVGTPQATHDASVLVVSMGAVVIGNTSGAAQLKLDSKYCDSRAAKGYTHMTSSPEIVPLTSVCSHNKRQHRKESDFRCISEMPWGNIDCSIVVSLFPVRKITRSCDRWTKASDVKLPMSLFDKSSVVRFCRKLDKNPDGIFLI